MLMKCIKNLFAIAILAAMTVAFSSCGSKSEKSEDDGFIVSVGDEAPDFVLKDTKGDSVRLSDYRGKVVMLQFTASWCRVCREEMPFIEKDIWQKYKDNEKFALFAIDIDEESERIEPFFKTVGATYPALADENCDAFYKYAGKEAGVTRNVLIDVDGKIIYLTRLYGEVKFKKFVSYIDSIMQK